MNCFQSGTTIAIQTLGIGRCALTEPRLRPKSDKPAA
jgi:hypothetical protein